MTEKNVIGMGNKDDQLPVFKSDIMSGEQPLISAVGSLGSVSPISSVKGSQSSFDGIEVWRYMSEKYKRNRLAKGNKSQSNENVATVPVNPDKRFQTNFENDNLDLSSQRDYIPWQQDLMRNILKANLPTDADLIEISNEEDFTFPDDGVLRVGDVMTKQVISVLESTTAEQVINIFNKHNISCVPVIHYLNKSLIGIFSVTDILNHIFDENAIASFHTDGTIFRQDSLFILEKPVSEYMTKQVIHVPVDCPVKDVCNLMSENNIHRIIVTDNQRVRGIFSSSDAVKILAEI